ncbi:MAG: zinc ribbon domain-containing protein [Gammaproteobacteria bacterium]|nr:zinc ribbon domain-containing protein [Gammaproteobacteria bacterium]
MPIYEYRCRHCQHQFDKLQKMSDAPLQTCPQCQHETLNKLISASGFQLKGSGWYVTDFRDNDKKPSQKGSSDGGSTTTSETSTDTSKTTTTQNQEAV